MTRAKVLLYLSHPRQRSNPQQGMEQVPLSNFLKPANLKIYFAKRGPLFHDDVVQNIASILRLPVPNVIIPDENIQLLSHEDDILPEDGRGEKQPPRWDNDDRTYRPGQRLGGLERPQLSDRKSDGSFKPSYTTTMQSMSGFSSAKNVLEQQPVNVSFIARSKRDSGLLEEEEDDDDYFPERPTKKRGASLENGQRRMQDFLGGGAGNSAPKPTSTRGFKGDYPKKGPNAVPFQRTTYASKKPVPVATAATYNLPSIDPSLRQHRIGSNTLPATRRAVRPVTPPAYTNAYINIISSSPQKPSAENAVPVIDLTAEPDLPPLAVPKLQGRQTTMSSTSFHNTTVDRLGAKNGKRTLGVKRSMNGWANRKGAGDPKPLAYKVTPSVVRCPRCRALPLLCWCSNKTIEG
jgi:DNA helicase-2/ATP-dependent DNA helicase PcrA